MTDQEINIAIAETCGWTNIKKRTQEHVDFDSRVITHITGVSGYPNGSDTLNYLPDYCKDLNAMHEAEKMLENPDLYEEWLESLYDGKSYLFHATARQRAEAFLRTFNLWEQ